MPSMFDDLMKDRAVANHPLLSGSKKMPLIRQAILKHAQSIEQSIEQQGLEDLFSQKDNHSVAAKDLNHTIHAASRVLHDSLVQFNIPVFPKISYQQTKNVKYAKHDDKRVVSGAVIFGAEFKSITGISKKASIPVFVSDGEIVPPSVMEVDGCLYTIAQSSVDQIVDRVTSYYLAPMRGQYSPPMSKTERELAVGTRNQQGWQPIENDPARYMNQKIKGAVGDDMIDAPEDQSIIDRLEGLESIPEVKKLLSSWYKDKPASKYLVSDAVNAIDEYATSSEAKDMYADLDTLVQEIITLPGMTEEFSGPMKEASRKTALRSTPPQYKQVVDAMLDAWDDGEDTFPRSWTHVMRNYVLNFVSTASKDAWEPHLINDGFCMNPYGGSRNRGRPMRSASKKAQDKSADFEKELEFEVDGPVEDLGEETPKSVKHYPDTKTPIEPGDGVRCHKSPDGNPFKATIVEISEDGDYLILKAKGVEYRVTVEDIQPVPSTFKKMYK